MKTSYENNKIHFFILATLTFGLSFLSKELLNTEELVINSLAEVLTNDQIQKVLSVKNKWQFLGYLIVPLLLLIKIVPSILASPSISN